ncbi:hypothetical protein [Pedobacter metabolipauper]|uniref:PKD family protein n=1 Tax=Pedobacter metabolipauper TaxID=425513 RepID=A0A4R6STL9_9SPHI|nr:hypothetical protein [Pedobacter metabolipauper]TDQ08273.1 hypothetical protein ATK78_2781 [Pedobacter metabolipauper]
MKNYIKYSLSILTIAAFYSCSKDEVNPVTNPEVSISIKLKSDFAAGRYNVVVIDPEVTIENGGEVIPQYKWTIKVSNKDGVVRDSVIGDTKVLPFIAPKAADYTVELTVTAADVTGRASTLVKVSETNKTYNSKAWSVVDYMPSPEFILNDYVYSTKAEALEAVQTELNEDLSVPLGTFGGYITTRFDHTVINAYGKRDFTVQMENSNSGTRFAPVSVFVAYDANKNGIADDNEWYEIAGSEYHKSSTVKNYEITYYKPDPNKTAVAGAADWQFDTTYLKWTDNKSASGSITRTKKWRRYNYYPQWIGDSYTMKGTKLQVPVKDISDGTGITFNVGTFDWGYGGIKDPSIDISWAVDKDGKKVQLPGIDFVKVYQSSFAEIGASDLLTAVFRYVEDLN